MELFPAMKLDWLNGWLVLLLLGLTDGIMFLILPKEEVARLFDRSGWRKRQIAFTMVSKFLALTSLLLIAFTPLQLGSSVFVLGMVVVALGVLGLVKALLDFHAAPPDEPATGGIYRLSRHPQILSSSLVILGACIAVGSWAAAFFFALARLFGHSSLLAEEEVCLQHYGESYRRYMEEVPRYFLVA